ncbi:MAG: DEAD/DEAH box helicase [Planctomycetota bacterium]|jgi:superfamily II DNA/RNA helicase
MTQTGESRSRGRRRDGRGRSSRGGSGSRNGGSRKQSGPKGPPPEELKPIHDPPPIESFDEWPLDPKVLRAIAGMGITTPTPVQKLSIGPVLEGRDVIAKAETGTGKTLAFGAPMVSKLDSDRSSILGLVLCPTRELAQQVEQVLKALGLPKGLKTALLVGGDPIPPQVKALQEGAQLVVATPGRVLDLVGQRFLSFPWTEFAVLDEADEMLEIGFLDDVNKILGLLPEERQTLLFSATFPPALLQLARSHTNNPVELATAKGVATVDRITQHVCKVGDEDKPHVLKRLLQDSRDDDLFLVFCDRRTDVDRVFRFLERARGVRVKALHGGFDQASRFRVMSAFRSGEVDALIATDVASRGLDVSGVTHVVNYSPPRDISDYTHRIGRTGRAGATGHALTFVGGPDNRKWRELVGRMTWDVPEIDEHRLKRALFTDAPAETEDATAEEERPRRRSRERDDDRPRRRERDDDARGSRRRGRSDDEESDGRRRRDRDDSDRRRDRDDSDSRGRSDDRPRRRRDSSEEARDGEGRRRTRDAGDERPRRRTRETEDDRPRRRSASGRAEGNSRPSRRERGDRAPASEAPSATDTGSSFGAGLEPERSERSPRRRPAPERTVKHEPEPARDEPREEASEGGAFGAGL